MSEDKKEQVVDQESEEAKRQAGEYADADALEILKKDAQEAKLLGGDPVEEEEAKSTKEKETDDTPPAEEDAAVEDPTPTPKPKPDAVQARIDELTREKYEMAARLKAMEDKMATAPSGPKTMKDYGEEELRSIAQSNPEYADQIRDELAERKVTRVIETKLREQSEQQQRTVKAQSAGAEWQALSKAHPDLSEPTSDLYQQANRAYVTLFYNAFGRVPTREDAVPGFATAAVAMAREANSASREAGLKQEKSRVEATRRKTAASPLGGEGRGAAPVSDEAELRKLEKAAAASGDDNAWQRWMLKKAELDKKRAKAKVGAPGG